MLNLQGSIVHVDKEEDENGYVSTWLVIGKVNYKRVEVVLAV